jgi:hypothetical protein
VYVVFTGPLPRLTQVWAALLRAGPGAAASHQTAAELDGLCAERDHRVHVTAPVTRRVLGRRDGMVVHYAHRLPQSRHPSKSPPRTRIEDTVLDLVDVSRTAGEVEGWLTAACEKRLTTPDRLAASLTSRKKISWRPMLEASLLDVAEGARSPLELAFLRNVERAHGLPRGERQLRWAGRRVIWIDVDYLLFRTRVELDGQLGHQGEGRFRDRRRQPQHRRADLVAAVRLRRDLRLALRCRSRGRDRPVGPWVDRNASVVRPSMHLAGRPTRAFCVGGPLDERARDHVAYAAFRDCKLDMITGLGAGISFS